MLMNTHFVMPRFGKGLKNNSKDTKSMVLAFGKLNADEVFSLIRDTNIASQNVARRNGMRVRDKYIKHYRGVDMPHYVFSVKRSCMLSLTLADSC